jgi:hypothetical protein
MTDADADLLRLLLTVTEDLYRAVTALKHEVEALRQQVAVRVITLEAPPPLPSIQQDEQ